MLKKITVAIIVLLLAVAASIVATHDKPTNEPEQRVSGISYLPLGDSYTIGQSVPEAERWPNQLAHKLTQNGVETNIVTNPAVTGYTTQNLIDRELPLVEEKKPDFVTVQIGVNDFVQGVPTATFQKNLVFILDTLSRKMQNPKNIILVTIPDYGKTPTGAQYGTPEISEAGVTKLNAIIMSEAKSRGLAVVDIFPLSQRVTQEPSLTAPDGLHPSGLQYTEWTNLIYPAAETLLR